MTYTAGFGVVISDDFKTDFDDLAPNYRKQTLRKIELLAANPNHPSLNTHRLHSDRTKWECYVTDRHRMIFDIEKNELRLWHVGDHDLVDFAHRLSFASHTAFRRLQAEEAPPTDQPELFSRTWDDSPLPAASENPFAMLHTTHLRILGVPAGLVKAVRQAPSFEALEHIEGLPPYSLQWLTDLATNPAIPFDPARLIFRTTLDKLEGYCEGKIKRLMLNLVPEQQRFVDMDFPGAALLRGCAGSGKTTVAIYRAIRFAQEGARVLFITYNKTLAVAIQNLIEELVGPLPPELTVINLDALIWKILEARGIRPNIANDKNFDAKAVIIEGIQSAKRVITSEILNMPPKFFQDEIAKAIKANGLPHFEAYRAFRRIGRGTPLGENPRRAVWHIYEYYQAALASRGLQEFDDVRKVALQSLSERPYDTPFDHAIIDEAQDLTTVQLQLVGPLVKPAPDGKRQVFLVGDSAQTLYTRGFAWQAAGFNLRGYSFGIRRNFRSTREIVEAAAALSANNVIRNEAEGQIDPGVCQRNGVRPIVLRCDTIDRERRAVREEILNLVEGGTFRLSDFAVLCPTRDLCQQFQRDLDANQIPCAVYTDKEFHILEEQVKILTIHSAKGLEFPIIFVVGLHEGTLPRWPTNINDEEDALMLEDNRILLYVGMTRAAEALYLVTSEQNPSRFLSEIAAQVNTKRFTGV